MDRKGFIATIVDSVENIYFNLIPARNPDIYLDNNIVHRYWYALSHVFFEKFFYPYLLITIVILYLMYRYALKHRESAISYSNTFPELRQRFDPKQSKHLLGAGLLLLALGIVCYFIYYPERSFWENGDTMTHAGFIMHGFVPIHWGHDRFFPLAHQEWTLVYPITTNMLLIRFYLFSQVLLTVALLYRLMDHVSVFKRMAFMATFILLPSILKSYSCVIYSERHIINMILIALLFFRRFYRTGRYRMLWFGFLFFYLAFYLKETVFLVPAGFLILMLIKHMKNGDLKLMDFLHPLRTLKKFPMEVLFTAGIIFYFLPFTVTLIDPSSYTDERKTLFVEFIKATWMEHGLFLAALYYFVRKIITLIKKEDWSQLSLFPDGLMAGACIFHLAISKLMMPSGYYLMLSAMISAFYILYHSNLKLSLYILLLGLGIISLHTNIKNYRIGDDGKSLGDIYRYIEAEFIGEEQDIAIFLADDMYKSKWKYTTQTMASKLYYPDEKILYKNSRFPDSEDWENQDWQLVGFHTVYKEKPDEGDLYMTRGIAALPQGARLLYQTLPHGDHPLSLYIIE